MPDIYTSSSSPLSAPPLSPQKKLQMSQADDILQSPSKQHSQEADELDFLCQKLSDVRVKNRSSSHHDDDDIRLSDVSAEQFASMVSSVGSVNTETLRSAVVKFRKLLAHEDIHPYLEKIVSSGVIPHFVALLTHCLPELQFESAWILTNIAAGSSSQTDAVARSGAIPLLVQLMATTEYKEIKEQCTWCLGNIAGDGAQLRERVVRDGGLDQLISLITQEMNEFLSSDTFTAHVTTQLPTLQNRQLQKKSHNYNLSTLRIAIWALSNFCRGSGKSQLDWNLIDIAMPILSQVITCCSPGTTHSDDEIVMDACWALSRTLRGIHENVTKIIVDGNVCRTLGAMICYENADVQIPALRCLINIVSGCDAQTQVVIDADILPALHSLLHPSHNETVRKEACLIISNITAGSVSQVQAVVEAGIFPTLTAMLATADFRTKREACWAVGNALLNREFCQVEHLVRTENIIMPLMEMINPLAIANRTFDERVAVKVLESFRHILQTGDAVPDGDLESEALLLHQFTAISISNNSKPSSAAKDLHPFKEYFYHPSQCNGRYCAADCIKAMASSTHQEDLANMSRMILKEWQL